MAQNDEELDSCRSEGFLAHDFADFAQEFLRRNAAYRDHVWLEYAKRTPAQDRGEDLARRWGLCFPHGSARLPTILARIVVPGRRAGCHGH